MICAMFRNIVDLHAEGRLAGFQARWMERHAAACPRCAAELAAWRGMLAELGAIQEPQAPEELKEALRAALAAAGTQELEQVDQEDAAVVPHGRAWEPSLALAAGFLTMVICGVVSAIGPGIPN